MFVTGKAIKDAQEIYYLANGQYADSLNKLDIDASHTLPANKISLKGCSTTIPASVYVYHPKISGVFIIFAYANQCASLRFWENRYVCYASSNNARANRLCSGLSHIPPKSGCGQYCTYDVP